MPGARVRCLGLAAAGVPADISRLAAWLRRWGRGATSAVLQLPCCVGQYVDVHLHSMRAVYAEVYAAAGSGLTELYINELGYAEEGAAALMAA